MTSKRSPETDIAQACRYHNAETGAIMPSIEPSTTFARDDQYKLISEHYSYARDENPSNVVPENMLAKLEGGEEALLFSSGMAAAVSVFQALSPGDHVIAPTIMYWGLRGWLVDFSKKWGLILNLYDAADPDALKDCVIDGQTKIIWIETPCNPTWDVIDIESAASIARSCGAKLIVDSTVSTPILTRPFEYGADIIMHSATKYLNGHGDVVAGALVCKKKDEFWNKIRQNRIQYGAIIGSFEAWLLQRGMRTLHLRVIRASETALKIAHHFDGHKDVHQVLYPGLPEHPGHSIAKKQMSLGFGGMLSMRIKGGEQVALRIVKACEIFIRATSLGGVESLIEHRFSIEGEGSPIPKDLIRISVGIESADDLIQDLENSFYKSI